MELQKNNESIEAGMAMRSGKGKTSNWGNKKMQFETSFSNKNEDYYGNNQFGKAEKVKAKAKGPKTIFKPSVVAIFFLCY